MTSTHKKQAFEYLVFKLVKWYESNHNSNFNDLSILKVLKLTFFVSAVGTTRDTEGTLLDNVFDNYFAMPYGHVESDIYNSIKLEEFINISINNSKTEILPSFKIENYNKNIRVQIDESVENLKKINFNFIYLSSFELVDLSHSWYSWQKNFKIAKKSHLNSIRIPIEDIKSEDKIYEI